MDAGTARGKTHTYVNAIATSTARFVIGTQAYDLSISVKDRLIKAGVSEDEIRVISSRTDGNCTKTFKSTLKAKTHRILIVDQSVVMRRYEGAEDFHLILDEAPKIDRAVKIKAAERHMQAAFTSIFEGSITYNSNYYQIECTPVVAIALREIRSSYYRKDEDAGVTYSKKLVDLSYDIENQECVRVLVKAEDLRHWKGGTIDENDRARAKLVDKITFHPTLKPFALGAYKSATIACANATKMEFYNHWLPEADFEAHPLCSQLRDDISDVKADKIHLHFISEEHGSWYELNKLEGGYQRVLDHFQDAFLQHFPNKELLFCMRKAKDGETPFSFRLERPINTPFDPERPAIRLSSNTRGVDEFKHIHCAAILSPLNPTTPEFKFKRDCHAMSSDEFRAARALETNYQFASRISIRDFDCQEDVHIFVLDRLLAEGLQGYFKCAEPTFFDIGIAEMRKKKVRAAPKTGAERQNTYLENQRAIKNDLSNTEQYDGFKVIQWARRGADQLTQTTLSWFEMVAGLEAGATDYKPKSKSATKVFREGDLADLRNHKLRGNIKSTKLIFLDIDNALLDPKLLSNWLYKNGWSHVIYHSYSSTNNEKHIRVVIGLDIAVNADNYTRIIKLLEADIISQFGTFTDGDKKRSVFEIDQSKMTINCSFQNPCVPCDGVMPFIKRTVMEDGKFQPKFLCVEDFLKRHQVVEPHRTVVPSEVTNANNDPADVEAIFRKYEVPQGSPGGHRNFYLAGQDLLLEANCTFHDVQQLLKLNRHRFGTPDNRSVDGVMNSLRRYFGHVIALREAA